eukprot:TRINITY_DN3448_c0_g2_i2.p1 TRINITY_DN3448_c0_g2~~TRINITY_DN3448_c0_g2_i2.p1  ORF type:complete len:714 (+),score=152.05 TRINITY_DN3448_c0_g2_i2:53-2194(+)
MDLENSVQTNNKKEEITSRVNLYFNQIMNGCGTENCCGTFCNSNPALHDKLLANDAAQLAVALAMKNDSAYRCPESLGSSNFLNFPKVEALINEANSTGDFAPVIEAIEQVFSNEESLNTSFMKPLKEMNPSEKEIGIDLEQVRNTFDLLLQTPLDVQDALANSIETLLRDMQWRIKSNTHIATLRKFIILFENPQIEDPGYYRSLSGELFVLFTDLPFLSINNLNNLYFSKLPKDSFLFLVRSLQTFIAFTAFEDLDNFQTDPQIIAATKILDNLYNLNKSLKYVSYEEFYSDVINEHIDLSLDYKRWNKRNGFSFCNFPFILTPEIKSHVLRAKQKLQQEQARRSAFLLPFLTGSPDILIAPSLIFTVNRERLLYDSINMVQLHMSTGDLDTFKKPLRVKFEDEDGIDEGGVRKEWFQLLIIDLFNLDYGMFVEIKETRSHWFNGQSMQVEEYELLGIIMGLAIYNSVILDLHFPTIVYKKLAGVEPDLEDLKDINPALQRGLQQLLDYEGDASELDVYFMVEERSYGAQYGRELIEGGEDILVTNENKEEYVDLYVKYLLVDSVKDQFKNFKKGFMTVCGDGILLSLFSPEELNLLVCGSPELNFYDLEQGTIYDGYDEDHPTIKLFWEVVHEFTMEQKKKLLFFATGSDRAPIGGLSKLRLVIAKSGGEVDRFVLNIVDFNRIGSLLPILVIITFFSQNINLKNSYMIA